MDVVDVDVDADTDNGDVVAGIASALTIRASFLMISGDMTSSYVDGVCIDGYENSSSYNMEGNGCCWCCC